MTTYLAPNDMILREGELANLELVKQPGAGKHGCSKQSIAFNLLRRLRQHADAVLLFIHAPLVPFTNNLGERTVRMPKVKQKISGCFRTLDGVLKTSLSFAIASTPSANKATACTKYYGAH